MSVKKNLVVSITDLSDEMNGIPNTVAIDFRTVDDGSICLEPKANKLIVKQEDLEEALRELQQFRAANPKDIVTTANKLVVESTGMELSYGDDPSLKLV